MHISESRQSFTYGIHSDIQMPIGSGHAAVPSYRPPNKGELAHKLTHTLHIPSVQLWIRFFLAKATTEAHAWASIPTRETFIPTISCHNTQWPSLFFWRSYRAQQINETALVDLQRWREIKSRSNEEGTETQTARWAILEKAKWSRRRLESQFSCIRKGVRSFEAAKLQERILWVLNSYTIMEDARPYPMPNGAKPRNHVAMTAATSLWGIFSVIKTRELATKSNLGIIDVDTIMWDEP